MECRRCEKLVSMAAVLLSIFSGLFIQLIIYRIFGIRIKDVPTILFAVLWIGVSTVTTHIVVGLEI